MAQERQETTPTIEDQGKIRVDRSTFVASAGAAGILTASSLGGRLGRLIGELLIPSEGYGLGNIGAMVVDKDDLISAEHGEHPEGIKTPPKTKEFPKDILTAKDLADLNVKIISTQPTVDLLIRNGALTAEPLFQRLQEVRDRYEGAPADNPVAKAAIILCESDDLFDKKTIIPDGEYTYIWAEAVRRLKKPNQPNQGCVGMYWDDWHWMADPKWNYTDRKTKEVLKGSHAMHHRYYIFLAVSGDQWPMPSQSFISPNELVAPDSKVKPSRDPDSEDYSDNNYVVTNRTPGFVLRHEFMHFRGLNEHATDDRAYAGISADYEAWLKGDDRGYHFVLVNKTLGVPIYTEEKAVKV